ncbi:MAG: hypothetical protein L0H55_07485 [Candidatus Nitrosocosmicus sp.]|nr:hypothetical protein [Candidatus Nitrosocosmicus sp.]
MGSYHIVYTRSNPSVKSANLSSIPNLSTFSPITSSSLSLYSFYSTSNAGVSYIQKMHAVSCEFNRIKFSVEFAMAAGCPLSNDNL